jgi:FMN phosphatase YigB (HAD superfamily)
MTDVPWFVSFDVNRTADAMEPADFRALLDRLKAEGFQIGLAITGGPDAPNGAYRVLAETGLDPDDWPIIYRIGDKEESSSIKSALNQLSIPAHRVIFIDDAFNNIQAAQACGIKTVRFFFLRTGVYDYTIDFGLPSRQGFRGDVAMLGDIIINARRDVMANEQKNDGRVWFKRPRWARLVGSTHS